jgi:hypothetical protein
LLKRQYCSPIEPAQFSKLPPWRFKAVAGVAGGSSAAEEIVFQHRFGVIRMATFKTEAQKSCYEKIFPWLQGIWSDVVIDMEAPHPTAYITAGSACVLVEVLPWGDDDAVVNTRSYVVTNVDLSPELMHYLLRENDRLLFGAFGIDADGDIFLNHAIVGSECDRPELEASVQAVLSLADEYDDAIVSRWGGQRAVDRVPSLT